MITKRSIHALDLCAAAIATAVLVAAAVVSSRADEVSPAIDIGDSDLGGVVTGPAGPEAGVWVIAETSDLATKFAKVVVTDERGRYVVPDLPKANYSLWVRGYGLVDSAKVQSAPGKLVNLTAVPAPTAAAAAEYYPASTGTRCSRSPPPASFPAPATRETALASLSKPSTPGSTPLRTHASPAMRSGRKASARSPKNSGNSAIRPRHGRGASSPDKP